MKSSRFFDKQGHFRVMFLCNPNRKTNEIALFFIFIQKPLIKLILYHNCRPALRYVAVLTAAIHSCFNSSTGHLSTKLRTAGLHFFETDTVWKVSKYGVISGPYFPAFGLNTERYFVLCISPHSVRVRENADQKNSVFEHFSRSWLLTTK